jgi:hypothetical protein
MCDESKKQQKGGERKKMKREGKGEIAEDNGERRNTCFSF